MTMGPAPMINTLWMSVLFGTFDSLYSLYILYLGCLLHILSKLLDGRGPSRNQRQSGFPLQFLAGLTHFANEAVEEPLDVVRPGTGFRVSLEAEGRSVRELDALQTAVE